MTEINTREVVLDILMEILERDGYSHLVLQQVLSKYQYLNKQQRSFITRAVQGTVERKIELDAVLNQISKTPVKKMKPVIRTILRGSVYEILHMDGARDAAVCDEAVKLAKKRGFYQLRGFVNGVLRNVCRKKEEFSFQDLSVRYSMPKWILDLWSREFDQSTIEGMLAAFLAPAPTWIRVNTLRNSVEELEELLKDEGINVSRHPEVPYALKIEGYDYLPGMKAFLEGRFYVQDVSSMRAVAAAGIKPGFKVIDVCGAPGGKSLDAAMLADGYGTQEDSADGDCAKERGTVECRDISDYKVELIQQNIARCGLSNVRGVKMDALAPDEDSEESADVVLADLPCSGLGIIGKKPDIKYHMTLEKAKDLVKLQRDILSVVCAYVKEGGVLLYSTCTIHRAENQGNVEWFLRTHSEFSCTKMEQILPQEKEQDGFFYAVLHKRKHT